MELYVHIPFCVRKCNYCDFLSFACNEEVIEKYVKALITQIEEESNIAKNRGYYDKVSSIYFGGGTPSRLSGEQIKAIMSKLYECFDVADDSENTIEVNPGTVELCKLKDIRSSGFNRVSIGMQSTHNDELAMLGRIHDYDGFLECFDLVRQTGFDNVNVDVMTALPEQNEEKLKSTLDRVIKLNPEHISAYSLIIEEGTPFYEKYGELDEPVVGQELERKLYHMTADILTKAGYRQYEISNFAKEGFYSRHNSGYWDRTGYIGLGLGASSLIRIAGERGSLESSENISNDARIRNVSDIDKYLKNPMLKEEVTSISISEAMDEFMFLGLRKTEGVNLDAFYEEFKERAQEIYKPSIDKFIAENLVEFHNSNLKLTRKGVDYGNYVFAGFLRD